MLVNSQWRGVASVWPPSGGHDGEGRVRGVQEGQQPVEGGGVAGVFDAVQAVSAEDAEQLWLGQGELKVRPSPLIAGPSRLDSALAAVYQER
jgi:hypothetical protein